METATDSNYYKIGDIKRTGNLLGIGSFSVVSLASVNDDKVALKAYKRVGKHQAYKEVRALQKLRHQHLVRLIGIINDDYADEPKVLLSYMEKGSLVDYLQQNRIRKTSDRVKICHQIACGVLYLHDCRIIHRDLAARNVLIDSLGVAKISDLGFCKVIEEGDDMEFFYYGADDNKHIPIRWSPMESTLGVYTEGKQKGIYSFQSDVYSFGVTMWEVWTDGKTPFETNINLLSDNDVLFAIHTGKNPLDYINIDASKKVRNIITAAMAPEWSDRPSFLELRTNLERILKPRKNSKARKISVPILPLVVESPELCQDAGLEGTLHPHPADQPKSAVPILKMTSSDTQKRPRSTAEWKPEEFKRIINLLEDDQEIIVISVTGMTSAGKNVLLDSLLQQCHLSASEENYETDPLNFTLRNSDSISNRGLFMWPETFRFKCPSGKYLQILLIDHEGISISEISELDGLDRDSAALLGLLIFTSSCLIYNFSTRNEAEIRKVNTIFGSILCDSTMKCLGLAGRRLPKLVMVAQVEGTNQGRVDSKTFWEDNSKLRNTNLQIEEYWGEIEFHLQSPSTPDTDMRIISETCNSPINLAKVSEYGLLVKKSNLLKYFENFVDTINSKSMPTRGLLQEIAKDAILEGIISNCLSTFKTKLKQLTDQHMSEASRLIPCIRSKVLKKFRQNCGGMHERYFRQNGDETLNGAIAKISLDFLEEMRFIQNGLSEVESTYRGYVESKTLKEPYSPDVFDKLRQEGQCLAEDKLVNFLGKSFTNEYFDCDKLLKEEITKVHKILQPINNRRFYANPGNVKIVSCTSSTGDVTSDDHQPIKRNGNRVEMDTSSISKEDIPIYDEITQVEDFDTKVIKSVAKGSNLLRKHKSLVTNNICGNFAKSQQLALQEMCIPPTIPLCLEEYDLQVTVNKRNQITGKMDVQKFYFQMSVQRLSQLQIFLRQVQLIGFKYSNAIIPNDGNDKFAIRIDYESGHFNFVFSRSLEMRFGPGIDTIDITRTTENINSPKIRMKRSGSFCKENKVKIEDTITKSQDMAYAAYYQDNSSPDVTNRLDRYFNQFPVCSKTMFHIKRWIYHLPKTQKARKNPWLFGIFKHTKTRKKLTNHKSAQPWGRNNLEILA